MIKKKKNSIKLQNLKYCRIEWFVKINDYRNKFKYVKKMVFAN